jgi:hypothetical protein
VQELDCGGNVHRLCLYNAEEGSGFEHEKWPKAFAAAEDRMPHGRKQPLRYGFGCPMEQARQPFVNLRRSRRNPVFNPHPTLRSVTGFARSPI